MAVGYDDLLASVTPEIAPLVMPGGGLSAEQVPWLLKAGVRQLHLGGQVRPGGSAKAYVDAVLRPLVAHDGGRPVDEQGPMILIDPPNAPGHGRLWSHLASDTSYDELHVFAREIGIPERGFDRDHYDVPSERYDDVGRGRRGAGHLARADRAPARGRAAATQAITASGGLTLDPAGHPFCLYS